MQEKNNDIPSRDPEQQGPPFFRHWSGWYAVVLAVLAVLILLFYLFTKHFA